MEKLLVILMVFKCGVTLFNFLPFLKENKELLEELAAKLKDAMNENKKTNDTIEEAQKE